MKKTDAANAANWSHYAIFGVFIVAALLMWLKTKRIFFLFDLPYIGLSLFAGFMLHRHLPKEKRQLARKVPQLLIGLYFLFVLGLYMRTNMQVEGFFLQCFYGVFSGAIIHYTIAKLAGPLLFNRGFCGWACWTAMVLDFLPWKASQKRYKYYGILRYLHLSASCILMVILFYIMKNSPERKTIGAVYWMVTGNVLYYVIGVPLACMLKDNRAFCKYFCPIPPLQKIGARFALLKPEVDNSKCIQCGICEKNCLMNIKILDYAKENKRILSTECILCMACRDSCPKDAIQLTKGFDAGFKEKISFNVNK